MFRHNLRSLFHIPIRSIHGSKNYESVKTLKNYGQNVYIPQEVYISQIVMKDSVKPLYWMQVNRHFGDAIHDMFHITSSLNYTKGKTHEEGKEGVYIFYEDEKVSITISKKIVEE